MTSIEALVCIAPGQLRIEYRSRPSVERGQVLVRPRRIGICGTDYHIYEGKHPFLQYPRVMGHELAVEIVEAPEASGLAPGDICVVNPYLACGECAACTMHKPNCCMKISVLGVHGDGGMQELIAIPAKSLVRADGLTVDECATVEFLAIGAHAVRRGGARNGETALVIGAGPIGLGVALFAKLAGANVTMLDRDKERAVVAKEILGVDAVVATDDAKAVLAEKTKNNGFNIVFDATGNAASVQSGFDHVGHGGRYVLVSVVKDMITFSDPDFHRKEMTLFGSRNATSEDFERVISAIRAGDVPIDRLVTHRTSLQDAVVNLPLWARQKSGLIKALIEIN